MCEALCIILAVNPSLHSFQIVLLYRLFFLNSFLRSIFPAWLRLNMFCDCRVRLKMTQFQHRTFNSVRYYPQIPHSTLVKLMLRHSLHIFLPHVFKYLPKLLSNLVLLIALIIVSLTAYCTSPRVGSDLFSLNQSRNIWVLDALGTVRIQHQYPAKKCVLFPEIFCPAKQTQGFYKE